MPHLNASLQSLRHIILTRLHSASAFSRSPLRLSGHAKSSNASRAAEQGQTTIEYALIVSVLVLGIAALMRTFFDDILADAAAKVDGLIL